MDWNLSTIEATYRRRADEFFAAEKRYARRDRMVMNLRVATFLVAVALFVLGGKMGHGMVSYLPGGIAVVGFFALVVYHEHVLRAMRRSGLLRQINEQAIARLHRDWKALRETRVAVRPEHRATAGDLDLFGHASLFHLLCSAHTPMGIRCLRDWLLEPARAEEVRRRQEAAAELAPWLDLRHVLILEGRLLADGGRTTERFVEWAQGDPWLAARPALLWLVRILSATAAMIPVLVACGAVSANVGVLAFLAVLCLNCVTIALFGGRIYDIFARLGLRYGEGARFLRMFGLMDSMPNRSAELSGLKGEVTNLGGGVLRRMRQLNRIALLAMIHRSAALVIFVYLPLQVTFLYDLHVLSLLEAWQSRYGRYVRDWFAALAEFEALASLATLVYDHPQWATPALDEGAEQLRAQKLGHPLLPCQSRVDNDVEIGPPGSFLLVTGSNMSGKSTLLRAVGVNVVLAQAGAVVCAEQLVMPPVALATSMRVRDSLSDGVSFYMAELMRLKEIVDLAGNAGSRNNRLLLYLLDEILLGTNSKERHLAVVRVLHYLIGRETIGAISTHDVELATSQPLAAVCRCVHFRETLHGRNAQRPMTFDYRLRPGVATTTNALKLLEMVGLRENDEQ